VILFWTLHCVSTEVIPKIKIHLHITRHNNNIIITTLCESRRREMYSGHDRLCVCRSLAAFPHYCTDPDVTWGNGRGCSLVVRYLADLQSVHWFWCYDNIAPNAKCQPVLVLPLRLITIYLTDTLNGWRAIKLLSHAVIQGGFNFTAML